MSDVPELDQLLDEHEIVRRNLAWDRRDRFFRRSLGYMFAGVLAVPVLGVLFGPTGGALAMLGVLAAALPVLVVSAYIVLRGCFTDPPARDPTRRYKYM